jgi:hypothetical protein
MIKKRLKKIIIWIFVIFGYSSISLAIMSLAYFHLPLFEYFLYFGILFLTIGGVIYYGF